MCKSEKRFVFLDLGFTPLADNFLSKEQLNFPEIYYPLNVFMCKDCGLIQLGHVVSPELMYHENYLYETSITKTGNDHFTSIGKILTTRFNLNKNSLVIDVGSNVGVLLSGFRSQGIKELGIEPSRTIANIAIQNGIETIIDFFSTRLASIILKKYGHVSIITATNVFAHIDNLDDFAKATDLLLTKEGVLVIEAPYLPNLLDNLEYDTIYHEHLSYLSLKPMVKFFEKYGMEVFDVEKYDIHGGTLRYYVGRKNIHTVSDKVDENLKNEEKSLIYSEEYLEKFACRVFQHKKELFDMLYNLKKNGKKIVAISSPAKGNTLLNYCNIGNDLLNYVTEKSSLKIEKFTPGTHIPIYPDEKLLEDVPDYALILAWNFADEIIKNNLEYRKKGGKFIIPIPKPCIL
jgi:hypothetical protein